MTSYEQRKTEYLRKLDIRIKRWVRLTLPDAPIEEQQEAIAKLIDEGEKMYDEVSLILNDRDL